MKLQCHLCLATLCVQALWSQVPKTQPSPPALPQKWLDYQFEVVAEEGMTVGGMRIGPPEKDFVMNESGQFVYKAKLLDRRGVIYPEGLFDGKRMLVAWGDELDQHTVGNIRDFAITASGKLTFDGVCNEPTPDGKKRSVLNGNCLFHEGKLIAKPGQMVGDRKLGGFAGQVNDKGDVYLRMFSPPYDGYKNGELILADGGKAIGHTLPENPGRAKLWEDGTVSLMGVFGDPEGGQRKHGILFLTARGKGEMKWGEYAAVNSKREILVGQRDQFKEFISNGDFLYELKSPMRPFVLGTRRGLVLASFIDEGLARAMSFGNNAAAEKAIAAERTRCPEIAKGLESRGPIARIDAAKIGLDGRVMAHVTFLKTGKTALILGRPPVTGLPAPKKP